MRCGGEIVASWELDFDQREYSERSRGIIMQSRPLLDEWAWMKVWMRSRSLVGMREGAWSCMCHPCVE
jgi:hypothetical protein